MNKPCPHCQQPIAVVVEVLDITPTGPDGYDWTERVDLEKAEPALTILKGENAETGDNDAAQGEYHG